MGPRIGFFNFRDLQVTIKFSISAFSQIQAIGALILLISLLASLFEKTNFLLLALLAFVAQQKETETNFQKSLSQVSYRVQQLSHRMDGGSRFQKQKR